MVSSLIPQKTEISEILVNRFMNQDIFPDPTMRDLVIRARIIDGIVHVRLVTNEFPKVDLPVVAEQVRILLNKEASSG